VTEFLSCRPNLEVDDLAPAAAFLREVLGFEVEVDEPGMGLMLLRRDAVGLALVQSASPGVNATTAAYLGVTGVEELHEQCAAHGARIVASLADHPWGLRDFVIEMPGGHRLALGERITPPRLGRPEPRANPARQSCLGVAPFRGMSGRFATPVAVGRGYAGNSFQCPSETTSTVPSLTLMAVWSSIA
jgi:predicted enzyme related to lactoylglutathione lyase